MQIVSNEQHVMKPLLFLKLYDNEFNLNDYTINSYYPINWKLQMSLYDFWPSN